MKTKCTIVELKLIVGFDCKQNSSKLFKKFTDFKFQFVYWHSLLMQFCNQISFGKDFTDWMPDCNIQTNGHNNAFRAELNPN